MIIKCLAALLVGPEENILVIFKLLRLSFSIYYKEELFK